MRAAAQVAPARYASDPTCRTLINCSPTRLNRQPTNVRRNLVADVAGGGATEGEIVGPGNYFHLVRALTRQYRRGGEDLAPVRTAPLVEGASDLTIFQQSSRSPELPICCNRGHSAVLPSHQFLPRACSCRC